MTINYSIFTGCAMLRRAFCPLGLIYLFLCPALAFGHAGETHDSPGVSVDRPNNTQSDTVPPIDVGGPFSLIDHHGNAVTNLSYAGKHLLVFFGYTNCQIMCSISLKRIGSALDILAADDAEALARLVPMIVTVDPRHDTPSQLRQSLSGYHQSLVGHTGTSKQLNQIYRAYNQTPSTIDGRLNGKDIVNHSSFFYLMGTDGELKTLFPPILNPQSMANILKTHIRSDDST